MQNYAEENILLHEQINELKAQASETQKRHDKEMSDAHKRIGELESAILNLETQILGTKPDVLAKLRAESDRQRREEQGKQLYYGPGT